MRPRGLAPSVLAGLLSLLAIGALIWEIANYHLTVPYWDEWAMVDIVDGWLQRGPSVGDLFAQHNEHRPVFPRLAMVAIAVLTGWNTFYACMLSLGFGISTWLCLVFAHRRACSSTGVSSPLWVPPALAVLLFSLNQWENWLWGWQGEVFLNVFAVTAALVLLGVSSLTGPLLLLAIALGSVASLSFANGLLVWPIGLGVILCRTVRRVPFSIVWAAVGALAIATYFWGFQWPALPESALNPLQRVTLMVRILGVSVSNYRPAVAQLVAGSVALLACAWLTVRAVRQSKQLAPVGAFVGLMLYAIGSAILVGAGRGAFLSGDEIASKYVTFSNLLWASLLALIGLERPLPRFRMRRVVSLSAVAIIAGSTIAPALEGRRLYQIRRAHLTQSLPVLFDGSNDSLLSRFYPDPVLLRTRWLPLLRAHGLSIFDCGNGETASEWRRAAAVVEQRARPQDVIIASNDWAAECLARHLTKQGDVALHSARGVASEAARLAEAASAALLITGGDVGMTDAAAWMTRAFPVYTSTRRAANVFYYPDRLSYLRDRLTTQEHAQYAAVLWDTLQGQMLVAEEPLPFMLDGWSRLERHGNDRAFRWAEGHQSRLYVPVIERRPARLQLDVMPFAQLSSQSIAVHVDGAQVAVVGLSRGYSLHEVDLSSVVFRPGGHIIELRFAATARPIDTVPESTDARSLAAVFRSVRLR